jgi:nitrite reductase/ring-hydroxylating ferredoxin subunit
MPAMTSLCPTRRVLLGLVPLSAVSLAACSAHASSSSPTAPSAPPSAPASASTAAADALVTTDKVPVGGGVVVDGMLVVQPSAGTFKAYDAACPHKGVQVAAPSGGVSTCPAHKSVFKIEDGSRVSGPATRGLTEIPIKVVNGSLVRA